MYTNTPEGENTTDETPLRNFENQYHKLIFDADEMPVVGFLNSEKNRFFSAGFFDNRTTFWLQAAILRNIPSVMYNMREPQNWKAPVLVANEVRLLTVDEIALLKKYAENGGTLVLTGICGEQDENARFRSKEEINALWGIDMYDESFSDSWKIFPLGKGRICRVGYNFGYPGTKEENKLRFVYDERRRKRNYVAPKQEMLATPASRKEPTKLAADYNLYSRNSAYFDKVAALIRELAGDRLNFETSVPDLVLAEPYHVPGEKTVVIHLVNAMDTFPASKDQLVSHNDVIPFPAWKGKDGVIKVKLPAGVEGKTAVFVDLSLKEKSLPIRFDTAAGMSEIILPGSFLKDYGMIKIQ
jgi:hypothetical protein